MTSQCAKVDAQGLPNNSFRVQNSIVPVPEIEVMGIIWIREDGIPLEGRRRHLPIFFFLVILSVKGGTLTMQVLGLQALDRTGCIGTCLVMQCPVLVRT